MVVSDADSLERGISPGNLTSRDKDITAATLGSSNESSVDPGMLHLRSILPPELAFLTEKECNPDLMDPAVRKIGFMRSVEHVHILHDIRTGQRVCHNLRHIVGTISSSFWFQFVVMIVIMFDCSMSVAVLVDGDNPIFQETQQFTLIADWVTVIVMFLDVFLRVLAEGAAFIKSWINIMEALLVAEQVVEFVVLMTLLAATKNNTPLPLLKALRPIVRCIRIMRVLLRTAGKGSNYLRQLKHKVSGERQRFMLDGFDLDLVYITPQVIAMSSPVSGTDTLFRNSYFEVARFLNERHGSKYLLVNGTELQCPLEPFFNRSVKFSIPRHGVPSLGDLKRLCEVMERYIDLDQDHVIVIHSENAQGRVALIVVAYLLFRDSAETVDSAISFFEMSRIPANRAGLGRVRSLDGASQKRFLEYFARSCRHHHSPVPPEPRSVHLKRLRMTGVVDASSIEVKIFGQQSNGWLVSNNAESQSQQEAHNLKLVRIPAKTNLSREQAKDSNENVETVLLSLPARSAYAHFQRILEEGSADSKRSGCEALKKSPVISVKSTSHHGAHGHSQDDKALHHFDHRLAPTVWELDNVELTDEFHIEFSRMGTKRQALVETKTAEGIEFKEAAFTGGMIFCVSLHSAFLELSEFIDHAVPVYLRPPNHITVVLCPQDLDKAAGAPSLRGYSKSLQIQLEFEVRKRVYWGGGGADASPMDSILCSGYSTSDEFSLGWLTWISLQIWPKFLEGFQKMIQDSVAKVSSLLPGPLKQLRCKRVDLGDGHPAFGPISACRRDHGGFEVQLDLGLNYKTKVDVQLELHPFSFGIDFLSISGILSLKFKPIVSELPVFTAVQMLFLNPLDVELHFSNSLDFANRSWIRSAIIEQIQKAIGGVMVLPNTMNVNWADTTNPTFADAAVSFTCVLPCAVLRLRVVKAADLKTEKAMFNAESRTRCRITVGSQSEETTSGSGEEPSWDEVFEFLVYDERQQILAEVFQVDFAGRAQVIGKGTTLATKSKKNKSPHKTTASPGTIHRVTSGEGHPNQVNFATVGDIAAGAAGPKEFLLEKTPEEGEAIMRASESAGSLVIQASLCDLSVDHRLIHQHLRSSSPSQRMKSIKVPVEEKSVDMRGFSTFCSTSTPREAPELRGDSVALLLCEVFGGRLPAGMGDPGKATLKLRLGSTVVSAACSAVQEGRIGELSEATIQTIESLSDNGVEHTVISNALGLELVDVARVIRKKGVNLAVPQPFRLLLSPEDLEHDENLEMTVLNSHSKALATGSIPISRLCWIEAYSEVVSMLPVHGTELVELDVELRLFVVLPREALHEAQSEQRGPVSSTIT